MTRPQIATLLLGVLIVPTLAAQRRNSSDDRGGPELGVARISALDGDVRILRSNGDQSRAEAGMGLFPHDALLTGADSRAEVQLDLGNFIRLSGATEVRFVSLGRRSFRLDLLKGVASYTQMKRADADVSIETPLASVMPLKPGLFTIEHRETGQTDVTVRDGQVEIFADGRSQIVKDDTFTIRGEGSRVASMRAEKSDPRSDFEQWAKRRDKMLEPNRARGVWAYPPLGGYWDPWYAGFGWGFYGRPYYGFGGRTVVVRGGGRGAHRGGGRRR